MSLTFQEAVDLIGCALPAGLVADAEVPVLSGPQRQGDVAVFPRAKLSKAESADHAGHVVAPEGVAVVRSDAGGHTHHLHVEGPVTYVAAPTSPGQVALGVLHVPEGATAWLIHDDEHGASGIGPGVYTLHGKREQADEIRRVAD